MRGESVTDLVRAISCQASQRTLHCTGRRVDIRLQRRGLVFVCVGGHVC
jgi:hypothetical protein